MKFYLTDKNRAICCQIHCKSVMMYCTTVSILHTHRD